MASSSSTPEDAVPAKPMLRIAVGSTNRVKMDAVRQAFMHAFPSVQVLVQGFSTSSEVPDQPIGDEETRTGAFNRAVGAADAGVATGLLFDYSVGLEGGVDEETIQNVPRWSYPKSSSPSSSSSSTTTVTSSPSSSSSSSPLTIETYTRKELICFAWMAVLHMPTGQWGCARTGSFSLPPQVATLVRKGVELGVADDMVFQRSNSKQEDGAVGLLSKGVITRTVYYEHSLILALIPFISAKYYCSSTNSGNNIAVASGSSNSSSSNNSSSTKNTTTTVPMSITPPPKGAKQCPGCNIYISHPRGHSDHFIGGPKGCPNCHTHFCFNCLHNFGKNQPRPPCPNGCPLHCSASCSCDPCTECELNKPCMSCSDDGRCKVCKP